MNYYTTTVKYEKRQEDGSKIVSEQYLCEAVSVTDAEAIVVENVHPYTVGEFLTTSVKASKVAEIMGNIECGRFWLAKVVYITIDEKTAKEKRTIFQWLIGAEAFPEAYSVAMEEIKKYLADATITSITESPVLGVFLNK